MRTLFALLFCFISLYGCASTSGVVRTGYDSYLIARTEERLDGSSNNVKATILKQANQYCESLGKILKVINTSQKDMIPFKSDATAEVQFMCLEANDTRLQLDNNDSRLKKDADIVSEKKNDISVDVTTRDKSEKTIDVYTELLKLDELKKKGIITEEEFEIQKKKLLN
jgi:hypothetical protein